jgi:hypothetical protein
MPPDKNNNEPRVKMMPRVKEMKDATRGVLGIVPCAAYALAVGTVSSEPFVDAEELGVDEGVELFDMVVECER